ncbi:diol dehydratase small subunit [Anderseniella sp. Alg231-50]|uniref:diol dehydratase small subunit n=1 Tax=Anderseniella sp. Alg231-50 TaxID=1922226 RepID=UPI000D54E811
MKSSDKTGYPLAETHPEEVAGARGLKLGQITMDAVLSGQVTMEDLRITPQSLRAQATIAGAAGRTMLASNFERAAEMTRLSNAQILEVYELLRPGRAGSKDPLLRKAEELRSEFDAPLLASMLEEAAEVYERRGLFSKRF